jgi:hypothetical protein
MHTIRRTSAVVFPSLCVLVYGYSALDLTGQKAFSVRVDLSRPEAIVWPCEIAIVGDMGEQGLRIGPNMGAGWKGQAGGTAAYRFYVPAEGKYYLWAYARWFDKCTNAVFARIDDHERAIVGNDPIFQNWHWVRAFSLWLAKGPHALELSNHSDNIAVQSVLFINSSTVGPEDGSEVFSDVFYDGFDGCHIGNFTSWDKVRGRWAVERPEAAQAFVENALVGRSPDSALILYRGDDWSCYSFHAAVKPLPGADPGATVGLLFGLSSPEDFCEFRWPVATGEDKTRMECRRCRDGRTELLAACDAVCLPDRWHEVEIVLEAGAIRVRLDGADVLRRAVDEDITGGIGFLLEGRSIVYFDDVHVRTVTEGAGSHNDL